MTEAHRATLTVFNLSLDQLAEAVQRFPDEAADWNPLPDGNPIGVLVLHALTATDFWVGQACGRPVGFPEYLAEARVPSFATRGRPASDLLAEIETSRAKIGALLSAGAEAHLNIQAPHPSGAMFSGTECLVHAMGHLREHVGHAETMSDFWRAGIGR